MKSKKIDLQTFKGNFSTKHGAPPGSKVIPTPNTHMTEKVWNDMAPDFEKVLQYTHVVKNYLYLFMEITLDGIGYNFEGGDLKVFEDHKILILKEEGDTSQVCQAYDNEVAKSNKRHHRDCLNVIRCDMPDIYQWTLIIVVNKLSSLFVSYIITCLV